MCRRRGQGAAGTSTRYDKPANPNALGTLEEAVNKIKALPVKPSFVIHTGDITHLSKPSEFDDADRIISQGRLDVHYVPGEHDVLDEDVKLYRNRYGRGTKGAGWYSFDANGVHFIGLVNVVDLKAGGLGNLGNEQLEWLEDDLKGRPASDPDRRLRAHSVVVGLSSLGLGHR
jgi:3',5'-cyclic AMP phosphodiesterase CpdA